jgi:hypothetical protein
LKSDQKGWRLGGWGELAQRKKKEEENTAAPSAQKEQITPLYVIV